jgi:hypothetical protein
MLVRTAFALLLLLPAAAATQELDPAVSAVVRISGTRGGTPVRGTGFVVGLDRDKATIVTASHVIEGVQQLEVTFAANLTTEIFPAGRILGLDAGNPHGLAAFQIRGELPAGVTILSFEAENQPRQGDEVFLVGFPEMALAPLTPRRVLSGRLGMLLLVDQEIGEGFSGGPVLRSGKVVGVVTNMDNQTTYAINAVVAREALEGWGVKFGRQSSVPVKEKQPESRPSGVSGEQMEAMTRAMTPGLPHKHLARLVGSWIFTNKMWVTPGQPPAESSGTMHGETILDGRYVQTVWKGNIMGMAFEGRGMDGYDNVAQKYVSSWVDNMGTGIMYSTGTCDDAGKVCAYNSDMWDPMTGKKSSMKSVITWVDDNTFTNEMYGNDPSGKEMKMMEITAKRK